MMENKDLSLRHTNMDTGLPPCPEIDFGVFYKDFMKKEDPLIDIMTGEVVGCDNTKFYPSDVNEETHPYHVEFDRGFGKNTWTLFRSIEIYSKGEYARVLVDNPFLPPFQFGHPYQLGGGVLDSDDCVGMNRRFIKYMVDALNEKHQREQGIKV